MHQIQATYKNNRGEPVLKMALHCKDMSSLWDYVHEHGVGYSYVYVRIDVAVPDMSYVASQYLSGNLTKDDVVSCYSLEMREKIYKILRLHDGGFIDDEELTAKLIEEKIWD